MSDDDRHNDYFLDGEEQERIAVQPQASPGTPRSISFDSPSAPADEPSQAPRRKSRRGRKAVVWTVIVCTAILGVVFYLRYLNPYATEARATGYVTSFEKHGIIFKTYEGTMVTLTALDDTSKVYERDFSFTVANDSIARLIRDTAVPGRRITLEYEKYYATLPWRGASKAVVTGVIDDK